MSFSTAVTLVKNFIKIGKEISDLPILMNKKYSKVAQDLGIICKNLLDANQRVLASLHSFRNYGGPNLEVQFLEAVVSYESSKQNNFYDWKSSCHNIGYIYLQPDGIKEKISQFLQDKSKIEELEGILEILGEADDVMVDFITDNVAKIIGNYINEVQPLIQNRMFNESEKKRLIFVRDTKDIIKILDEFSNELSDLVIKFAEIASVPIHI